MQLLKLKDNTQVKQSALLPIQTLASKISNQTLAQLEREGVFIFPDQISQSDDLAEEQMILQRVNDSYWTGNVMGFLGIGNERLIIESRFSNGTDDYFFQYLLSKVLDIPNIVDLETDTNQNQKLVHLLIYLFPHYLQCAMRKGLYKTYIRKNYNDGNVKGTIDIAHHIKRNTPFVGNIAYSQREYSYDNSLTELIRHTIEYIKKKTYGRQLLLKVKEEIMQVVSATKNYEPYDKRKIIADNMQNPIRHAYFREYRALQNLCILILKDQKHQIGEGSRRIYGILFDGAWLWEEYINQLLADQFYHPRNKKGEGAQKLFGGNIGLIYPDFISRKASNRIIADAKYKPSHNIGGRDYLQVLAYMTRFGAQRGYYLYPETGCSVNQELWLNQGSSYEKNVKPRNDICLIKHGLEIPKYVDTYCEFTEKMKASEENFRRSISTGIQKN